MWPVCFHVKIYDHIMIFSVSLSLPCDLCVSGLWAVTRCSVSVCRPQTSAARSSAAKLVQTSYLARKTWLSSSQLQGKYIRRALALGSFIQSVWIVTCLTCCGHGRLQLGSQQGMRDMTDQINGMWTESKIKCAFSLMSVLLEIFYSAQVIKTSLTCFSFDSCSLLHRHKILVYIIYT